jgi:dTDP-4-dehydrorhamnose reductase
MTWQRRGPRLVAPRLAVHQPLYAPISALCHGLKAAHLMRIFITGHKGQLGRALHQAFQDHDLALADLPEADITSAAQTIQTIADFRPDLVLHPAALTDTVACQRDPDLAYRVNALGTRNVALGCQRASAVLLQISTNEVFDGQQSDPYLEWDSTHALSVYAQSKLAGEWYVQRLLQRYYIVRIAWLYGNGPSSFVNKVLQWAQTNRELRIATDEVATPTYVPDLVAAIASLVQQPVYGVYHFTNSGSCSRLQWAQRILAQAGRSDVTLLPARLADFPSAAPKPAYSVLRNFCGQDLGITLRPWEDALQDYFRVLAG